MVVEIVWGKERYPNLIGGSTPCRSDLGVMISPVFVRYLTTAHTITPITPATAARHSSAKAISKA